MSALFSPQEPVRASGRTGLKGDHGEKVRGGGQECPSSAALSWHAPLCSTSSCWSCASIPSTPRVGSVPAVPRWELAAAARAAGKPAEATALLPQAGIEAPLHSAPLLEQSQPRPRASLFPLSLSGALPELGSISRTPRVPSLRGHIPAWSHLSGVASSPWWDPAGDPRGAQPHSCGNMLEQLVWPSGAVVEPQSRRERQVPAQRSPGFSLLPPGDPLVPASTPGLPGRDAAG